jgi:hypothetical protein
MVEPALDRWGVVPPVCERVTARAVACGIALAPGQRRTPRPIRDEHNECLIKCFDDCRECDRARQNHPRGDALL